MAKVVTIKDEKGEESEVVINTPASYMAFVGRDITGSKKGRLIKAPTREKLKAEVSKVMSEAKAEKPVKK